MLIFPQLISLIIAPILLAGVLGKEDVFCSSRSFFESLENPSPFCTISGIANFYLLLQLTLWGTFHVLGLCWGILFPFHYRRFKTEGRIKYIHVATLIVGLVLPAILSLVPLTDGYTISPSPIDSCIARNMVIVYYTITLPISVLMAASSTGLVILFWTIFKEFVLNSLQKKQAPKDHIKIAEAKILIVVFYYIILGCIGLSTFTYFVTTDDEITEAFENYFMCQSVGIIPGVDCGGPPNERPKELGGLASGTIILNGLLPLINLIIITRWTCKCFKPHRYFRKTL